MCLHCLVLGLLCGSSSQELVFLKVLSPELGEMPWPSGGRATVDTRCRDGAMELC